MDGQSSYQNPLELMRMSFCVPEAEDEPCLNRHFVASDRVDESHTSAVPSLPHWFQCQKTPLNYYEFLTESSALGDKNPSHDQLETIPELHFQGINEIQPEFIYNHPGLACGSSSKSVESSFRMDSWKLNPQLCSFVPDNHEFSLNLRYNEDDPVNKLKNLQDQNRAHSHILWEQEASGEEGCKVSQSHPKARVAPSVFVSNPDRYQSRQRSSSSDRLRRARIAERIKALQELLPCSVEGSQTSVMDEIINYVKFLQLQVKELSWSSLGGHLCSDPSVLLEEHHHYILHQLTMNEPLEDTMAKLLKANSSAATKFLESKGLLVMPIALVDRLKQTI